MLVKWIRSPESSIAPDSNGGSGNGPRSSWGNRASGGRAAAGAAARPGVAHLLRSGGTHDYYDAFMARPARPTRGGPDRYPTRAWASRLFEHRLDVKVGFRPRFADGDLLRLGAHCKSASGACRALRADAGEGLEPGHGRLSGMLRGVFAQGAASPTFWCCRCGTRPQSTPSTGTVPLRDCPSGPNSTPTCSPSQVTTSTWSRPGRYDRRGDRGAPG